MGTTDEDDVFHVNVDYLIEKYGENPKELANQLYHMEESRVKLYDKIKEVESNLEGFVKMKEQLDDILAQNKILKERAEHFEALYKNLAISGYYEGLRDKNGAKENVLSLTKDQKTNGSLTDFGSFFPKTKEHIDDSTIVGKDLLSGAEFDKFL